MQQCSVVPFIIQVVPTTEPLTWTALNLDLAEVWVLTLLASKHKPGHNIAVRFQCHCTVWAHAAVDD